MRRRLIALILAVVAFSMIAASAASLGGVNNAELGAGTSVVASCDSDGVDVRYRYRYHHNRYEIRRIIVRGISDDCIGHQLSLTISDGTNEVSRGPWTVRNRAGVDNNGRGWGVANGHIDVSADFSVAIVIKG